MEAGVGGRKDRIWCESHVAGKKVRDDMKKTGRGFVSKMSPFI